MYVLDDVLSSKYNLDVMVNNVWIEMARVQRLVNRLISNRLDKSRMGKRTTERYRPRDKRTIPDTGTDGYLFISNRRTEIFRVLQTGFSRRRLGTVRFPHLL